MTTEALYSLAAHAILVSHVLFVVFVVLGCAAIYLGYWLSWKWIRNFWFRTIHLGAIVVVVLQSWASVICPLTVWETRLRELSGQEGYSETFIQHWLRSALYYDAPEWVFVVVYTLFGGIVLASWFVVPPRHHN